MSRGVWFVAGAGAGVYAMVRGKRLVEAFTPDGLRDRVRAAEVGLRLFGDEVAQGRAETEPRVRRHLGLVSDGTPQLQERRTSEALTSNPSTSGRDDYEEEDST